MGQKLEFKRPDGKMTPGYLAEPASSAKGGIIVLQEWWGLNDQIMKITDRLADEGFRALAIDLFRGRAAANADEARHLMAGLDWGDAVSNDLRGAAQYLKPKGKVAALGFCMGGALTLLGVGKVPEVDLGVCFYGIPPAQALDPATIRKPLMAHFATMDDWCTPAMVDSLESKLKSAGTPFELHRYEAQHAFMNEKRPEVYEPAAAKLAWERSIQFLNQQMA
ncbi:MAG: dienelactone hydrolase family protein [Deltaproteobacteria bacterium]|nr:dienelactone hydrolase family protein [Deltaproteobacteria bacterium]